MTFVIISVIVLGLAAGAWWVSARSRPTTRLDWAARRTDADAIARRERLGIHEPPHIGG